MALLPPALACKEAILVELLTIAEQACPAEAARCVAGLSEMHKCAYM